MKIKTRKIAATEHKGESIKARAETGEEATIPFPYDMDTQDAHRKAAQLVVGQLYPQGANAELTRIPGLDTTTGYTFRIYQAGN
jgi:hypothetical protein